VESFCKLALAWCRRLPHLSFEAPPSNKLNVGRTLDLYLGFLVAPSSVLHQVLAGSSSLLPACRGGDGKGGCVSPCASLGEWVSEAEGDPSLRAFTLPARGPVLSATLGKKVLASALLRRACSLLWEGSFSKPFLCLPPPVRGRLGVDGIGEAPSPASSIQWVGSWKHPLRRRVSTVRLPRPFLGLLKSQ
jgi:hypothetical protein